ncbi:MAG: hypothetical protein WAO08_38025, partial [Hyphomicrobiaceae bacterium]
MTIIDKWVKLSIDAWLPHAVQTPENGIEGEANMTKETSSPRLGKLDLTRRTVVAGGAAVVLAPTYWQQASAQDKRIYIRDPGGPYAP